MVGLVIITFYKNNTIHFDIPDKRYQKMPKTAIKKLENVASYPFKNGTKSTIFQIVVNLH